MPKLILVIFVAAFVCGCGQAPAEPLNGAIMGDASGDYTDPWPPETLSVVRQYEWFTMRQGAGCASRTETSDLLCVDEHGQVACVVNRMSPNANGGDDIPCEEANL